MSSSPQVLEVPNDMQMIGPIGDDTDQICLARNGSVLTRGSHVAAQRRPRAMRSTVAVGLRVLGFANAALSVLTAGVRVAGVGHRERAGLVAGPVDVLVLHATKEMRCRQAGDHIFGAMVHRAAAAYNRMVFPQDRATKEMRCRQARQGCIISSVPL